MKRKKEEVIEEPKQEDFFVSKLEDLQEALKTCKLNPMEKVMAVNLLLNGYDFVLQFKVDLPEGWVVDNRKYFLIDFFLPGIELCIETDGKIHETDVNKEKDRNKDNILAALGYSVMRLNWDEVMVKNENYNVLTLIDRLIQIKRNGR